MFKVGERVLVMMTIRGQRVEIDCGIIRSQQGERVLVQTGQGTVAYPITQCERFARAGR